MYDRQGAHIHPIKGMDWENWSLHELLAEAGVTPQLEELNNPYEYVNQLSGWVNRLNDIRERLHCSVCNEIMQPNYKYAKNLAVYRTTVLSCSHGPGHDQNIYLNHCWGCESQIIDSRESRIRVDGYYLCIQCGSGPKNASLYQQGDVCPKCGSFNMKRAENYNRRFSCQDCGHTIICPSDFKVTGKGRELEERRSYIRRVLKIAS